MKRIIGLYNSLSLSLFGFPKKEEMFLFPQGFPVLQFSVVTPSENINPSASFYQEFARQMFISSTSMVKIHQPVTPDIKTVNSLPSLHTLWPAKITAQGNWLVRSHGVFLHRLSCRFRQNSWLPGWGFTESPGRCEISGFRSQQGNHLNFPDTFC